MYLKMKSKNTTLYEQLKNTITVKSIWQTTGEKHCLLR